MEYLAIALFQLIPLAALYAIVRYGPIPNRWRKREHPLGFALFVGLISFLIGFVGPMIVTPGANQGPLLGIFITGPIGVVIGLVWGMVRASRRPDA